MTKRDDIPKTDPSEIEALIQRLKQSNIKPRDAQLVERLLRLVLSMASLLQHKAERPPHRATQGAPPRPRGMGRIHRCIVAVGSSPL